MSLARFQDSFAAALVDPGGIPRDPAVARLAGSPGFAVYRNTVASGCVDALQANYPAVARLVGDEWFRAAAAVYVRANLPREPMLVDYGEDFAAFLAAFEPARGLPYLADVARLDRFWTEAHVAADATPVEASTLAALDPREFGRVVLRPHPSARWAWFADQPAFTLWARNRHPAETAAAEQDIDWRGEGALVVRPGHAVQWMPIDRAGCAFLDACATGDTLAQAAAAALATDPSADLSTLMARTLRAGAYAWLDTPST